MIGLFLPAPSVLPLGVRLDHRAFNIRRLTLRKRAYTALHQRILDDLPAKERLEKLLRECITVRRRCFQGGFVLRHGLAMTPFAPSFFPRVQYAAKHVTETDRAAGDFKGLQTHGEGRKRCAPHWKEALPRAVQLPRASVAPCSPCPHPHRPSAEAVTDGFLKEASSDGALEKATQKPRLKCVCTWRGPGTAVCPRQHLFTPLRPAPAVRQVQPQERGDAGQPRGLQGTASQTPTVPAASPCPAVLPDAARSPHTHQTLRDRLAAEEAEWQKVLASAEREASAAGYAGAAGQGGRTASAAPDTYLHVHPPCRFRKVHRD